MEQNYAFIEDGACVNVIVASPEFANVVGAIPIPAGFGIGDLFDGGAWSKRPPSEDETEAVREALKEAVGQACQQAIYDGVEVDTSQGGKHFSLTEHDQAEISAQKALLDMGAAGIPYHADGEPYRIWSADDFTSIARAASTHIFYHRLYCNFLNMWIARAEPDELYSIYYGAQLPIDLQEEMEELLNTAQP